MPDTSKCAPANLYKEMKNVAKRLCEMVDIVENNKACVVLKVKPEVGPMDLIALGAGFEGHEAMFRMSKDPETVNITVFREGENPFSMNYGASTTVVSAGERNLRSLIMECVNLDFGVFTHGKWHNGHDFNQMVEATLGQRDLDSHRMFEIQRSGGNCSLFVNQEHIANVDYDKLDGWLADRNIRIETHETKGFGSSRTSIGTLARAYAPEQIGTIRNGVVYPGRSGQGFVFKDEVAFENKRGICYIPEREFDLATKTEDGGYLLADCHPCTYESILETCEGNEEAAQRVFSGLGWQYPETLYLELKEDIVQEGPFAEAAKFADSIDKAFDSFLGKTGWQGMDTPSAVAEFVRFAKHSMEPTIDDLVNEAKEKRSVAAEKSADKPARKLKMDYER